MRTVQLLALSGLMLMSNVAMGAELERDDVPNRCWDVCGPVVGTAQRCDGIHHDNDRAEMQCICDWNQAKSLIPLCEACIAQYRSDRNNRDDDDDGSRRDPHDNDAYDILTSCSLKTTSYNPTAAASAASSASSSGTTNVTNATPTATSSRTSNFANSGSSGSGSNSNSPSNTNAANNAQNTGNAASAYSTPKAASLAAVIGLGFLAWM
ncbi:hypothetical protein BDV29DRAFT_102379 [Aspergillus leporis]|uniref:GPI anchored protein n=1 Tax=Aspergillus leporis TaxID=41062 RepID=A0A5N5X6U4_9EURO|nr:hypothetical protein BDV29DRAFT_102379 [Aspergillus leporis]